MSFLLVFLVAMGPIVDTQLMDLYSTLKKLTAMLDEDSVKLDQKAISTIH